MLGKYQVKQKCQHYITVITATRIFLEWFGLNVQFVQISTFVSSAILLELKFILTRAIIHTGLWLVTVFFRVTDFFPSSFIHFSNLGSLHDCRWLAPIKVVSISYLKFSVSVHPVGRYTKFRMIEYFLSYMINDLKHSFATFFIVGICML